MKKTILFLAMTAMLSTATAQTSNKADSRYYRLFMPFTFYHSVAQNELSMHQEEELDDTDQQIGRALMHVYMSRPDLVQNTETEMSESGELRQDLIDKTIEQKVSLTDEIAAPMPEEDDVAPVVVKVEKPNFWKTKGDGSLQFMQNYVSDNWYKGGESNYSAVGMLTLEANYDNKSKWKWDNKLEMKLGFQTSPSDTVHKFKTHEDLIRLTTKVGLQATKKWYYTLQVMAYTQFTQGLKANQTAVFSDFLSPLDVNAGLGMDYKVDWMNHKLTGTVNLSPIAVNYRYVDRTLFNNNQWFPSRYGIDEGKHHLTDLGSQITASLEWKLNEVVTWKSRIYAFTSYKRSLMEWENTFVMHVSKYITANLFLYPRFDDSNKRDDDLGYWQFKEYSSLGFSYNF